MWKSLAACTQCKLVQISYDTLVINPVSPSTIPDTVQGSLQRVKDYSVAYGG